MKQNMNLNPQQWKFWPSLILLEVTCFCIAIFISMFTCSFTGPDWIMGLIVLTFICWGFASM